MKQIGVKLEDGERAKIENVIKQEYPKLKTISDVVRLALDRFLSEYLPKEAQPDLSKVSFADLEGELNRRKEETVDFMRHPEAYEEPHSLKPESPEMREAREAYKKLDGGKQNGK